MTGELAAQLSAEHEALTQFVYLAPVGLAQAGMDGAVTMMNPIAAQLLMPLAPNACLDNLFAALEDVAPDLRHLCASYAPVSGMICDGLQIHLRPPSAKRGAPQVLSLSLLKLDAERLMAVLSDVTEQVRRERQLKQNDAWLNAILSNISDYAVASLDRNGDISSWNDTVSRVTGFAQSVVGQPYDLFYPDGATTPEHQRERLRTADANGWSLETGERLRADGSRFWASTMIAPMPARDSLLDGETDAAYCLIIRDISGQRADTEAARSAVHDDKLTGVSNRRAFFDAAAQEIERRQQAPRATALIVFDADGLKGINERFGQDTGDRVLRQLADVLRATFRDIDTVARIGGDEFAVLLPATGTAGAAAVAERVRTLVAAAPLTAEGQAVPWTVSAGVAEMDEAVSDLTSLMLSAERAMQQAKQGGRNRVISAPGAQLEPTVP